MGGFSSKAEAQRALQNKLARLVPGRRAAALTLGEWVVEYRSLTRLSVGCEARAAGVVVGQSCCK